MAKLMETWEGANLKRSLLRGIYSLGFEHPSPIQQQAILPILEGTDVLAQAQSGTGKTGAFSIAMLERCSDEEPTAQAIMLAPTRELASQINSVVKSLACQTAFRTQLLVGGTSVDRDIRDIRENKPQIFVGCPGRVLDFLHRRVFDTTTLRMIVLDEADEILSAGFVDQLQQIFQFISDSVQVVMFSATIPTELHRVIDKIMRDPIKILVKNELMTLEGISQFYISLPSDNEKISTLKDLYESLSVSQSIIYCNSVRRVIELYDALRQENFPVVCIHSDMERDQRTTSYNEFKSGKYRVLISTNVTARGIDVQQVSVVINFDIPTCETYLHRIGRSGRWGRKGVGINFVTKYDVDKMRAIEKHYATEIKEFPLDYATLFNA